jgi:hypothetical protein
MVSLLRMSQRAQLCAANKIQKDWRTIGVSWFKIARYVSLFVFYKVIYSLRPIILFANMDVSRHILVIDTSVLAKSKMGRRE